MTSQLQTPSLPAAVAAEQTFLQVPSQPEWIAPTVEYLKDKAILCGACPESRAGKLTLALHEALTNSVVHGNLELSSELKERPGNAFAEALAARSADPLYGDRPVEIGIDYDGERCRWIFTDQGKGFDFESALARADHPDPEALLLSSGRGILLMKTFLDEVRYEEGGRRVVLTLTQPAGGEKRRHARLPMHRPIRVAPIRADGTVDWGAAYEAVSRNLSRDGIALLQARLATTERILIGVNWGDDILYVPAEVRHCQARSGDVVELGCRFQLSSQPRNPPAAEDAEQAIAALLDQFVNQVTRPQERRAHPRSAYTARISVIAPSVAEPVVGFARDLSRGGLSFLTTAHLPLEDVVLSLPQPDQTALRVVSRIVRCNQLMAGIYDVGARFVNVAGR